MNKDTKKAVQAETNAYEATIKGFSVNPQTHKGQHINARVIFASEKDGETLSVYDPSTHKQISLPFEIIEQLIAHTRSERDKTEGGGNET